VRTNVTCLWDDHAVITENTVDVTDRNTRGTYDARLANRNRACAGLHHPVHALKVGRAMRVANSGYRNIWAIQRGASLFNRVRGRNRVRKNVGGEGKKKGEGHEESNKDAHDDPEN